MPEGVAWAIMYGSTPVMDQNTANKRSKSADLKLNIHLTYDR